MPVVMPPGRPEDYVPLKGRPNHYQSTVDGHIVAGRAGQTVDEIFMETEVQIAQKRGEPEAPPMEPIEDLRRRLDALEAEVAKGRLDARR